MISSVPTRHLDPIVASWIVSSKIFLYKEWMKKEKGVWKDFFFLTELVIQVVYNFHLKSWFHNSQSLLSHFCSYKSHFNYRFDLKIWVYMIYILYFYLMFMKVCNLFFNDLLSETFVPPYWFFSPSITKGLCRIICVLYILESWSLLMFPFGLLLSKPLDSLTVSF